MCDNKDEAVEKVRMWKKSISNFKFPFDDYDRSLNHYKGVQMVTGVTPLLLLKRICSFLVTPLLILIFLLRPKLYSNIDQKKAIFTCPNPNFTFVADDLPLCLIEKYESVHVCVDELRLPIQKMRIDFIGMKIIVKCFYKKPFSYWTLYILIHLSRIYNLISKYNPSIIITTQTETDFSSSLVTYYCEKHNVKYVCVQHGENYYYPGMAFVRFSEYFAWNQETLSILKALNVKIDFATIYEPKRLKKQYTKKKEPKYFITYYLEDESIHKLFQINRTLESFSKQGYLCNVRYHPRVKYQIDLKQVFTDEYINIENPFLVSLGDSISNTEYVVSYKSTVLSEAIANSMNAVIDDVNGCMEYLEEVCYINIKKTSLRLSNLLSKYSIVSLYN
jgi:hypothetical protein